MDSAGTQQYYDGYWQNCSLNFDNSLKPNAAINTTNALFLQTSYGMNGSNTTTNLPCTWFGGGFSGRRLSAVPSPASFTFMFDGSTQSPMGTSSSDVRGKLRVMGRHGRPTGPNPSLTGSTNVAFFDGHAETLERKTLPNTFSEFDNNTSPNAPNGIRVLHPYPLWRVDEAQ
jgi:prepilin-type processing-associated H-X9-DG protein